MRSFFNTINVPSSQSSLIKDDLALTQQGLAYVLKSPSPITSVVLQLCKVTDNKIPKIINVVIKSLSVVVSVSVCCYKMSVCNYGPMRCCIPIE